MRLQSTLILLCSHACISLATASCPLAVSCKGLTATVASALKAYPPAQTFCSRKFPVPGRTCTSTAPQVTTTTTAGTSTVTMNVATTTILYVCYRGVFVTALLTRCSATATTSTVTLTATITPTAVSTQTAVATVQVSHRHIQGLSRSCFA